MSKTSPKHNSNPYDSLAQTFEPAQTYLQAQHRAESYVHTIQALAKDPNTFEVLHADLKQWFKHHSGKGPDPKLINACQKGEVTRLSMLAKLQARGQLKQYLSKAITYLFIRDLGLSPDEPETARLISRSVNALVKSIDKHHQSAETTNLQDWLDEQLHKRQLTQTFQWLKLRLATVNQFFTDEQSRIEGMRKLVKVIAGILMHQMTNDEQASDPKLLSNTLKLGYAYGLTYPFVDDLLDSNDYLSEADKHVFNHLLRESLISGKVPDYPEFESTEPTLILIYKELKWAFEYIHNQLEPQQRRQFFEQAYIFFEAQTEDRARRLSANLTLSVEALFKPVILKSAGCRIISRDLVTSQSDEHFDTRMFCFGIYNQFNDDIKDIFDDIEQDNVTPYSYFLTHTNTAQPIDNPYHDYWAVVYYLIYVVYQGNAQVKQLLLERSINAHQSLLNQVGYETFAELQANMLNTPDEAFNASLQNIIQQSTSSAWFDKLVSHEVADYFKTQQAEKAQFTAHYQRYLDEINQQLPIPPSHHHDDGKIRDIANYAIEAGGKRIRPVIAQCIGRELYGFNAQQAAQVGSILEYMHTASLVMDDLPAQDDATTRRGHKTAHQQFGSVAAAELSVVYLMMHAVEVQANLKGFDAKAILASLRYAAATTKLICEGQLLDLESHSHALSIKQLERTCHTKTGLALEAAMVIPAILAEQDELHLYKLKNLARHMGLLFQIKDDLLDTTGCAEILGKDAGADAINQRVNFVTLYGEAQAQEIMFEHHSAAQKIVQQIPEIKSFFDALLDLMLYRLH